MAESAPQLGQQSGVMITLFEKDKVKSHVTLEIFGYQNCYFGNRHSSYDHLLHDPTPSTPCSSSTQV